MAQQYGAVATASAGSKHVSIVTVGTYNIGVFYPESVEVKSSGYGENFPETVRLVTRLRYDWGR